MIPRHFQALDYLLEGLEQRKLHFDREEFKGLLFERVYDEACLDKINLTNDYIKGRMCKYAAEVLFTLDEIYEMYDKDLWLDKDINGCYWISDHPPNN